MAESGRLQYLKRMKRSMPPPRDSATLDWKSILKGGGVFDIQGDHPNKKGWDIFELGQKSFWAVPTAIDWEQDVHEDPEFAPHVAAMLGFLLPGEKAAVTGASLISLQIKSEEAKFYFVEQALEEAKHFDALRRLIPKLSNAPPTAPNVWVRMLYSFGVVDPNDAAFMMGSINIIGEHLAHQIFHQINHHTKDENVRKVLHLIGKDESRHIAAGQRFFEEVRPQYEKNRARIMAKNLATLVVLTAASYELINPMNALNIDIGDVMGKMYVHYNSVVGTKGGFMEEAIVEFIMTQLPKRTRAMVRNISEVTASDGTLQPEKLIQKCEEALKNPRALRDLLAA